ncbi:MAG: immune inhibitor A [Saprospiraceae bacterium]
MYQNIMAAYCTRDNIVNVNSGEKLVLNKLDTTYIEFQNIGLKEGEVTLSLQSLSDKVQVLTDSLSFSFESMEKKSIPFIIQLGDDVSSGEEFKLVSIIDNGYFSKTDTFTKIYLGGNLKNYFYDDCSDLSNWNAVGNWGVTSSDYVSEPYSITDSPSGNYNSNSNVYVTLKNPVDLSNSEFAYLKFNAKWSIEKSWDFAQVMASSDGVNFTPLCGDYTVDGSTYQDEGQPIYDGVQNDWVNELIFLDDYVGGKVWIRFKLVSDIYINDDGFYFDDVEIGSVDNLTNIDEKETTDISNGKLLIYPNPANSFINIVIPENVFVRQTDISVYNVLGELLNNYSVDASIIENTGYTLDVSNFVSGEYFIVVGSENNQKYYGSFFKTNNYNIVIGVVIFGIIIATVFPGCKMSEQNNAIVSNTFQCEELIAVKLKGK